MILCILEKFYIMYLDTFAWDTQGNSIYNLYTFYKFFLINS